MKEIQNNSFQGCSSLQHVFIPSNIREIEMGAFKGCLRLKDVELCEGLERICIEAFAHCGLKRISVPSSVRVIGYRAFQFDEN
jgi:hypothetical protein